MAASRPRKLHFAPFCALHRTCAHFVARPLPGAPALLGCSGVPDDRCHSLLLASSAAGGARNRPQLHHIRVGLSYFMEDAAGIEPASHGCAHRASSNARPCHFQSAGFSPARIPRAASKRIRLDPSKKETHARRRQDSNLHLNACYPLHHAAISPLYGGEMSPPLQSLHICHCEELSDAVAQPFAT